MTKFFISQPMRGKTDGEIKAERRSIIEKINTLCGEHTEIEIIDSFFEGAPAKATPLWFLGKSIMLLGEADVVVFAKGWSKMNGCYIEHECAVRYGKRIVYV